MMNSNSVIRKTELGKQEVLNPSHSSLPRELRVILILIDGRKTVRDYYESLSSKRFLSQYPSVEECFMVLESMELIEIVNEQSITKPSQTATAVAMTTASTAVSTAPRPAFLNHPANQSTEVSSVSSKNNPFATDKSSSAPPQSMLKDAIPIVAEFIENNLASDCWSLMIQLEMVNTFEDLTIFLKSVSQKYKGEYDAAEFNKLIQRLNELKNT